MELTTTLHPALSLCGLLASMSNPVPRPAQNARSTKQRAHLQHNHRRQFEKAVERYRSVLQGRGWVQTKHLECLLGMPVTSANAFLRKLKAEGYVMNRPTGGTERYFRNRGWDWCWVDGA